MTFLCFENLHIQGLWALILLKDLFKVVLKLWSLMFGQLKAHKVDIISSLWAKLKPITLECVDSQNIKMSCSKIVLKSEYFMKSETWQKWTFSRNIVNIGTKQNHVHCKIYCQNYMFYSMIDFLGLKIVNPSKCLPLVRCHGGGDQDVLEHQHPLPPGGHWSQTGLAGLSVIITPQPLQQMKHLALKGHGFWQLFENYMIVWL